MCQSTLTRCNGGDVAIGPQRGIDECEKLAGSQLGLFLVIVDVVSHDHITLRGLAWLPCAQHNAHALIGQRLTNIPGNIQPGMVCFHHHIQQHDRHVGMPIHQLTGLSAGVGIDEFQRPIGKLDALERQFGDFVYGRLVVDDHDPPGIDAGQSCDWRSIFGRKSQLVVCVLGH